MKWTHDDWEYYNVCPWCGKLYSDVDHELGCPEPDPNYKPERQAALKAFIDKIYKDYIDEKYK